MSVIVSPTSVELELRYSREPLREAAARFIEGDNSMLWLTEMTRWGVSLAEQSLLVLPRSAKDVRPSGVLVPSLGGLDVRGRSQPYGLVHDRLYLPVNAQIVPPVDSEWDALLASDVAAYVWHPGVGLIRFETEDVIRVSDLIAPPSLGNSDWSHAQPGEALNRRLWTVTADIIGTVDEIIESGGDDIGSQAKQLGDQAPGLGQSLSNIGRGLGGAMAAAAQAVKRMFSQEGRAADDRHDPSAGSARGAGVGQGLRRAGSGIAGAAGAVAGLALLPAAMLAGGISRLMSAGGGMAAGGGGSGGGGRPRGGPGWLDGLGDRIRKLTTGLLSARQREINRLLQMLSDNPDEGLKYGIPFGGGEGHRGLAPPSWSLGRSLVNFSLGGLVGGGPVDVWDVDDDQQRQLIQRYRELAERELRLERYRRAAYIYAKLLGDYNNAASALMQGRHYREAAVLYRDKLNRPADAARAFENAGLFEEAITIYEGLQLYETIGDLHQRLEQPEEAAAAYERSVDQALGYDDRIRAARILKDKLADVDRALAVLEAGWPSSKQAKPCLDEAFLLTAELGRHDHAVERIEALSEMPLRDQSRRQLVETLCNLVGTYPDRRVEDEAADAARVLTSRALLINRRQRPLLNAIGQLAPADRLLLRDCKRVDRPQKAKPVPRIHHRKSGLEPQLIREIPLPTDVTWCHARSTSEGYYVAGYNSRSLVLVRGAWRDVDGQSQDVVTWGSRLLDDRPLLMDVRGGTQPEVALFPIGGPPLPPRLLRESEYFRSPSTVETPGWLPDDAVAMATSESGLTWLLAAQDLTLRSLSDHAILADVSLLETGQLANVVSEPDIAICAHDAGVTLGIGDLLVVTERTGQPQMVMSLGESIRGLAASPHEMLFRLCVVLENHSVLFRGSVGEVAQRHELRGALHNAIGLFLRDGHLILIDDVRWEVRDTRNVTPHLVWEGTHDLNSPIALLRTRETSQFAIVPERGPLQVFST